MDTQLPRFEVIGYDFKNDELLLEALTHRSFSVEQGLQSDNQRLEFLGDAVIQIIITEYLYSRYPSDDEGRLTRMRSALNQQNTLANLAKSISLGDFIRVGKGELKANGRGRPSTLCDAFEALTGAIYLDGGVEAAKNFIIPLVDLHYPSPEALLSYANPKGYLQEYTQKTWSVKPEYTIEEVNGPDHEKSFTVSVFVNGASIGTGTAKSRKSAESSAASAALELLLSQQMKKEPEN